MAIQQKMYVTIQAWGNVEQRSKELLTFFDRFVAIGTGEIVLDQYRTVHGSNGWSFRMDNHEPFEQIALAVLAIRSTTANPCTKHYKKNMKG